MIRAMIFDLDGTLVDTEPLHYAAFVEVLGPDGIAPTREEYFSRLIGFDDRDCFKTLLTEHRLPGSEKKIRELVQRKAAVYQRMIAERDLLYPGADKIVREAAARFSLAIATGTLRVEAETILRRAKLRELFADVVAAEDVEHGKPAPDCFLTALGRLGFILRPRPPLESEQCLVVEDTLAGITAAHRAGMKVLAIANSTSENELHAAEVVRRSFLEIDLDDVLRRL